MKDMEKYVMDDNVNENEVNIQLAENENVEEETQSSSEERRKLLEKTKIGFSNVFKTLLGFEFLFVFA